MKRFASGNSLVLALAMVAFLGMSALPSMADDTAVTETSARKAGRGLSNLFFGFIEIPKNMIAVTEEYGGAAGITWGTIRGVQRFVVREAVGVFELATCWAPGKPIIEPEFFFQPYTEVKWKYKNEEAYY